ncbi:DUF2461 domain-containing protein [Parasediminibacterium paludis]|uniref:DUF2461 domain-containing protein n=1 Tax=Parasediminibacterium paludis TaxID=908966 RepID=A0ABV8PU22_9BACT
MIQKETLNFFKDLEQNNNKPWFEANKSRYEAAKENYLQFIEALLPHIRKIESIFEKDLKKYASRVYRDIRFSKDKSPYKNNISGLIERAPDNKKCPFYINVQLGETFIGGGVWQPDAELLNKVRQEIDYNGSEFNNIINKKSFIDTFGKLSGEALVRPPKGYDADNPNIELLKLKQYIIHKKFEDDVVCSNDFIKEIVICYKEALPFFHFFDAVKAD